MDYRPEGNPVGEEIWEDLLTAHGWNEYQHPSLPSRGHLFYECSDWRELAKKVQPFFDKLTGSKLVSIKVRAGSRWCCKVAQALHGWVLDGSQSDFYPQGMGKMSPEELERALTFLSSPGFVDECQGLLNRIDENLSLIKKVKFETQLWDRFGAVNAAVRGDINPAMSVLKGKKLEAPLCAFVGASRQRRMNRRLEKTGQITYYVKGDTPAELRAMFAGSPYKFS